MMFSVCITAAAMALPAAEAPLHFDRQRIGDTIYEAASAFDVDKDGHLDIVSGEVWYPGPDFDTHHKITTLERHEDYYDNFSEYPMDVDGDGYLDIIAGGWWGKAMIWRENPDGGTREWTNHEVMTTGNIERNCFYDIDDDGTPEVFSTTFPVHFFRLKKDADGKGAGEFEHYVLTQGGGGHGFGFGDVNSDGNDDLVFSAGWLEGPEDPFDVKRWRWHPALELGSSSVPILVHDVNEDGKQDIIVGSAHDYGLWWWEQTGDPTTKDGWTRHVIEDDRSQFHEMQLIDLDNDGKVELVTGKRYRAHNGNDPGADDPLGLYYYDFDKTGKFTRNIIDYGPPGEASGTGIYLWAADFNGDGWKDIVAPGKEGLYLFMNLGRSPQTALNAGG